MPNDLDQRVESEEEQQPLDPAFAQLRRILGLDRWQVRQETNLYVAWKTDDDGSWEVSASTMPELLRRAWRHDDVRAEKARIANKNANRESS